MNSRLSIVVLGVSVLGAWGADYTFNNGNNAGWSYRLLNSTTHVVMRTGATVWSDENNYPNYNTDPAGDSKGSAGSLVGSSDYSSASDGDFLLLQLWSPDLTSSADWQSASAFSARLLPGFPSMSMTPDISACLAVVVSDLDTGTTRSFVSGTATTLEDATWGVRVFDLATAFSNASPPVVRYQIKQVAVNFYVAVAANHYIYVADPLWFYADNVTPRCAGVVYSNEDVFREAAGPTTTYGFESHGLSGLINDLPPSPIYATNFAGHFDLAYANLNGLNVIDSPGSACLADGTKMLFTHSVATAQNYSLTFSNFGGENRSITAFGVTICDFANAIETPATITYDTGTDSGILLMLPSGQPEYTHNFIGVIVCPELEFKSITLTFDDIKSGMQWFDEVIYSGVALKCHRDGSDLILTWPMGSCLLETADKITGPWTEVNGAKSPYPSPLTAKTKFFRLHFQ